MPPSPLIVRISERGPLMKIKLLLILSILASTAGFAQDSDLDYEVEKRQFTTEELQDFEIEDNSDLDYNLAEDYELDFDASELEVYEDNGAADKANKKGKLRSAFQNLFDSNKNRNSDARIKNKQSSTQMKDREDSSTQARNFSGRGYFPSDPRQESYRGSKMTIEVYKTPGAGLPEFVVAKLDGDIALVALASTARSGKSTPSGTFGGFHYRNMRHRSSLYNNSPMPYAQFFNGNIAFHGVLEDYYPYLGGRASAGCVRLQVDDGLRLWRMARVVNYNVKTIVYSSGHQPPNWELNDIQARLRENFKQRDYYVTNFQKNKYRSPYWPTGYFSGHGISP